MNKSVSFSSITTDQRAKEAKALKLFLAYSLIGSLLVHIAIAVLFSGIGNLLTTLPATEDEPIEVAIIDSPTVEAEKPLIEKKEEVEKLPPEKKETKQETISDIAGGSTILRGSAGGSATSGGGVRNNNALSSTPDSDTVKSYCTKTTSTDNNCASTKV